MGCRAAVAVLALAFLPALCAGGTIRGLDPKLAPRYQPTADGKFACLDGRKVIPFDQVNDDYCDCPDGSDEPGTSACPNGHFYCENKLFLPLLLNSSMVDDGVCDCCDGSDEPAGKCVNECYNMGHQELLNLKERAAAADKGVQARNKYVQQAAATKQKWADRKAAVEKEVEQKRKEKEALEANKQKLEDEVRKVEEKKKELEEEKKKLEAPAEPAEQAGDATEQAGDGHAAGAEAGQEAGDTHAAQGGEEAAADEGAADVDAELERLKSEADLARERMAQWIPGAKDGDGGAGDEEAAAAGQHEEEAAWHASEDAEHAGEHHGDGGSEPEEQDSQFFPDEGSDGADAGADGAAGGGDDGGDDLAAEEAPAPQGAAPGAGDLEEQQPTTALGKARLLVSKVFKALTSKDGGSGGGRVDELSAAITELADELELLDAKLAPIRSKADDARSAVNALEREQQELEEKLGGTYGEGDAYVALVDRCFEARVDKYTYEVCPFSKATQKEGGSHTSLGTWSGFEDGESKMTFKNGQGCWQGPSRSMTVTLLCGQTERLAKVEEPSRCEYTAELETPAACTPAEAEALKKEVLARQRLLEGEGQAPAKDEL